MTAKSRNRTIYRNASLLIGPELDYSETGYLVVEDGRISEMSGGNHAPALSTGGFSTEGIDGSGRLIIPSFINAHVHLGDSVCKDAAVGLPTIDAVSPPGGLKYRELAAVSPPRLEEELDSALRELLYSGIAGFCDFREGGAAGAAVLIKLLQDSPLRGIIIGEPLWKAGVSTSEQYLNAVDELLPAVDGIGLGDIAEFDDDALQTLSKKTKAAKRRIAVHAAETKAAQELCVSRWGRPEIERLLMDKIIDAGSGLLVHVTNPTVQELKLIKGGNVPLVLCVRTNAVLADGIPPLRQLFNADVPVGLGTDNMMFTSPDMFREMDFVSRLARVHGEDADAVEPKAVLKAATIGGARVLGLSGELGSLEPGKGAYFLGINMKSRNLKNSRDPFSMLVHRAAPGDIDFITAAGKIL